MNQLSRTLLLLAALLCAAVATAQDPPVEDASAALDDEAKTENGTGDYNRELRTVEEDVKRLKERVFRSKATLQLLKEIVLEGASVGSRVQIWHINKMGSAYTMEAMQYFLDGRNVHTEVGTEGELDREREVLVHEGTIPPGTHALQVNLVLRGSGYGVFSYMRNYSFKVQSSYQFKIEDGQLTTVKVIANERSGFTRTFVDRPSVQFEETVETFRRE